MNEKTPDSPGKTSGRPVPGATKFATATIGDQAVGEEKRALVRVIAFSSGGADNVFVFGMVHAFLVSQAERPHIVAGTSAGAVVAAMLADVLQADEAVSVDDKDARRLAQVARFRAFLEEILKLPVDFPQVALPDLTEISARAGLKPLDLPTQREDERDDRENTALAHLGLTKLFNGLLSSRIKFLEMTRVVRLTLEIQAVGEWRCKWLRRGRPGHRAALLESVVQVFLRLWTGFRIWLLVLVPVLRDAPLLMRCVFAPKRERIFKKIAEYKWSRRMLRFLGLLSLKNAKQILFESCWMWLAVAVLTVVSFPVAALAWFFTPPAIVVWLLLNAVERLTPPGYKRTSALGLAWLVLLLAALPFATFIPYHFLTRCGAGCLSVAGPWAEECPVIPWLCHCSLILRAHQCVAAVHHSLSLLPGWLWLKPVWSPPAHEYIRFFHWGFSFMLGRWRPLALLIAWFAPGIYFAAIAMFLGATYNRDKLIARFLEAFDIKKDLLTTGVLNKFLMRAFDPAYFGRQHFNKALNRALGGKFQKQDSPAEKFEGRRHLADWIWHKRDKDGNRPVKKHPILVAPVAADVATGKLVTLEPAIATVDALRAACSIPPLFAATNLPEKGATPRWLVDGSCVAREPIQPLLNLIKQLHLNQHDPQSFKNLPFAGLELVPETGMVDLCVISPFPTRRLREQERRQMCEDMEPARKTKPGVAANGPDENPVPRNELPRPGTLYRLADILALKTAHSGKDERILVTLYNTLLKKYQEKTGHALFCSSLRPAQTSNLSDWHVFTNLRELEPVKPIQLLAKLSRCADETAKRTLLLATMAEGCRVSLSGLFKKKLAALAIPPGTSKDVLEAGKVPPAFHDTPPCRKLQDELVKQNRATPLPGILGSISPPGIAEICHECSFYKQPKESWEQIFAQASADSKNSRPEISDWGEVTGREITNIDLKKFVPAIEPCPRWPAQRPINGQAQDRPLVSLIFSGGVFRGVFQVGVLNAYSMAGIKPDVVAGASVGTIMAALAARVFTEPDQNRRKHRLASVAATFLGIDRLVLTDRFADFIRRFTLRAGAANFSLRDADRLFRRFDQCGWGAFTRRSRRVLAGFHRLTYMDPLDVKDLLSLSAPHRRRNLPDRLLLYAQGALNRSGVGMELLGAEPLEQLIRAHVLDTDEGEGAQFDTFLSKDGETSIHFMATTTNLTTGELDVLGSFCNELRQPVLVPGLLASSAFPAVFRPRMSWEVRAGNPRLPEELIDGGIADNLPLISVYRFLFYAGAGETKWLNLRPGVESTHPDGSQTKKNRPHLLLTASLEPRRRTLKGAELQQTAESWPSLRRRVGELEYNVKVDSHRQAQADFRKIYTALEAKSQSIGEDLKPDINLLDLHVSCIKPEWLCGTFAFHPMLGFKRNKQAASIAHGCAMTLAHLYYEQVDNEDKGWTDHWWKALPNHKGVFDRDKDIEKIMLHPQPPNANGDCCFIAGHPCPYSRAEIQRVEEACKRDKSGTARAGFIPLGEETIDALDQIYQLCGKAGTHVRQ